LEGKWALRVDLKWTAPNEIGVGVDGNVPKTAESPQSHWRDVSVRVHYNVK